MSLAVLARKSKQYTSPVSGCGHNGFSLNGGYRNQGWVGQDMLGRTLIGTKFRGLQPLGHGGKNGKYTTTIINTCRPCTNDPSIIKRSNMNTAGYISSRLTPRGAPCDETVSTRCAAIWVQKFDPDEHSQSEYIRRLRAHASRCQWPNPADKDPYATTSGPNTCVISCAAASYHIGGKKFYRPAFHKDRPRFPLTCGEYTITRLLIVNNLPTPPCGAPWPPPMARDKTCRSVYVTPQEGYRAGILPKEWTNGGRTEISVSEWGIARKGPDGSDSIKDWAKKMFGSSVPLPLPPPPPLQQAPRPFVDDIPVCKRRAQRHQNTWYYKPGTNPTVPVGGSCNPGIIGARSRRAAGSQNAPTIIFQNPYKT
jgi:hypothetical protein